MYGYKTIISKNYTIRLFVLTNVTTMINQYNLLGKSQYNALMQSADYLNDIDYYLLISPRPIVTINDKGYFYNMYTHLQGIINKISETTRLIIISGDKHHACVTKMTTNAKEIYEFSFGGTTHIDKYNYPDYIDFYPYEFEKIHEFDKPNYLTMDVESDGLVFSYNTEEGVEWSSQPIKC
jgi:hypothetical protein